MSVRGEARASQARALVRRAAMLLASASVEDDDLRETMTDLALDEAERAIEWGHAEDARMAAYEAIAVAEYGQGGANEGDTA